MITPRRVTIPGLLALHVPWVILLLATAFYSISTTILYPLSFYTAKVFTWSDYDMATDDIAGYLAYLGSLPFFLIAAVAFAIKNREMLKYGMPSWKLLSISVLVSSLTMAVPWVLMGMFFDSFRFSLPGDGNWPSISVFSALACVHGYLVILFMKGVVIDISEISNDHALALDAFEDL